MTGFDELLGKGVEKVEVVRRKVKVRFTVELPAVTQPFDRLNDRINVLLFFLGRVGVVETHVAGTTEAFGEAEVQGD